MTRRPSSDASVFSRLMRDAQGSPSQGLSEHATGGGSSIGNDDHHRAGGHLSTTTPEGFADLVSAARRCNAEVNLGSQPFCSYPLIAMCLTRYGP